MAENSLTGLFGEGVTDTPPRVIFLSILMAIILSGAMGPLSLIHPKITWVIWGCIYIIIILFAKELFFGRLFSPIIPYLVWLCFYLIWGLIVSPITDIAFAGKTLITTVTLGASMAILTAKPQYLQTFANFTQFGAAANLLLWMLIPWSSKIAELLMMLSGETSDGFSGFTRYGGMPGNANMLGYVCLVATILSVLAVPWIAWMGRLSCIPILYLTASRKYSVLYLVILLLYIIIVQRKNVKFWITAISLSLVLPLAFLLSDGLTAESHALSNNRAISRILDVEEKATEEKGGTTRVGLLEEWLKVLVHEPWYGYGLEAMAGDLYDDVDPAKLKLKGPFPTGTHNTYLGVWIEDGPVGFIAFIIMLLYYARMCLITGDDPITKWLLVSFLVVNVAFLFVSHNHLFALEGKASFALFFLLPFCAGLRERDRLLT